VKNRISDLRNHLFSALEALADPDKPMDIERARAIADVAQTVINSAKVEVDFIKAMSEAGGKNIQPSEFLDNRPRLLGQG